MIYAKNTHSCRNNKDPSIPCDIPAKAWTTLQMDLFTLDGHSFLLVVDVTSQFPVVRILKNEMATSVINALKGIYCDFGLPRKILVTMDLASDQWILRNFTLNWVLPLIQ